MKVLVIIEGADGTGKTTLALELAEYLDAELLHRGPPTGPMLHEYLFPVDKYVPGEGRHIVCDRWHLGELVYGPLLRSGSRLKDEDRWYIEHALMARGALVVHCHRNRRRIIQTLNDRGDDLITPGQVQPILDAYRDVVLRTYLPVFNIDPIATAQIANISMADVATVVAGEGRAAEFPATELKPFPTYVGDPHRPWMLLLGDIRNNHQYSPWRDAFVPVPASSGRFLLQSLLPVMDRFALANAVEEDVRALIETVQPGHVVALGLNAQRACEEAGVDYGAVPHPQFVRRFHHAHGAEYADTIIEAGIQRRDMISWRP